MCLEAARGGKSQLAKSPWREPGTASKWISSHRIYCNKRESISDEISKYISFRGFIAEKDNISQEDFLAGHLWDC